MSVFFTNQRLPATAPFSIDLVLESARGLAALWVFLFHIAPLVAQSLPFLHSFALIGYYGVPVFFVVTGYCIFAAAQRAKKTGSGANLFLRRRALRIFRLFGCQFSSS